MNAMVPETYFTVYQEVELFFYSIVFGILLGIVYDAFRALRSVVKHNCFAVLIEDCVFFLIYAVLLTCFAVMFSRSQVRFFYVVANFIGFFIYYFTFGRIVFAFFRKISALFDLLLSRFVIVSRKYAQKAKDAFVKCAEIVRVDKKMNVDVLQNKEKLLYNKTGLLSDGIEKRHNKESQKSNIIKGSELKSGKIRRKKKG